MTVVALTGATGFIGRHLLETLPKRGYRIRVLLRRPVDLPPEASGAVVGDLLAPRNMAQALRDVDAVIHSAGIAHAPSGAPENDFRAINTEATVALARAAERAGVRRFVFMSSVRAQAGPSAPDILTEEAEPQPTDAYGRSKLEAERGLAGLGLDWVALRPVLVYGPGAKGNMAKLLEVARSPYPLPFGAFSARRSLLSVENLAEAVAMVLAAPEPLRRALLVADPEPVTVPEMIAALREGLGRRPGLLPVPARLLGLAARALGRLDAFDRLNAPLVASAAALTRLGWRPPVPTTQAGLAALARTAPAS